MIKVNYFFSVAMSLLALFFYIQSLGYSEEAQLWPQTFVYILVFLSILLIIDSHRNPNREQEESSSIEGEKAKTKFVVYTIIASIIYLILMDLIGFLVLTPIFLIFIFKMMGYQSWKLVLSLSFGVSLGVTIVFQFLLRIPIPQGVLQGFVESILY